MIDKPKKAQKHTPEQTLAQASVTVVPPCTSSFGDHASAKRTRGRDVVQVLLVRHVQHDTRIGNRGI